MTATILNPVQYTEGATLPFTLSAGANRRIIVDEFRIASSGNVTAGTGLSYGGVAGRFDGGSVAGASYPRVAVRTYSWSEADISAMSGAGFVSSGGSGGNLRYMCLSIQGADQTTPTTSNFAFVDPPLVNTGSLLLARTDGGFTKQAVAFNVDVNIAMANPVKALAGAGNNTHIGYQSDSSATPAAATFTGNNGLARYAHVVANYLSAPSQAITSINDDDEINPGEENTAEVDGYIEGVNPVVSGTVGSLALTGVSQTDTTVKFTPPAPTNAAYWPGPDTAQTLTLTDGSAPATLNALFTSVPGHTSVVIDTPDNDDPNKLGYWATSPLEDGDRVMFLPSAWTINPDGSYEDAPDGVKTWYHWRVADSTVYIYEATVGEGVIVVPVVAQRQRSVLRVSGNAVTVDGNPHTNGQPISLSPYGGVQSGLNGVWVAQSVSADGGDLIIGSTTIVPPAVLYVAPHGGLTTTPNGKPVAVVRS